MTTDAELISRTLQGDTIAFGHLVHHHQDRLLTSIVHLVGQREEAEDIVQDAFVQALVKLGSFQGSSSFYTWLYRIAINSARARYRQRRPETPIDLGDGKVPDRADPSIPPTEHVVRIERAEQVRRALQRLREPYRSVLVLREIDGCDYQSIAEILETSVGTVRSRLYRARALMREELERSAKDFASG